MPSPTDFPLNFPDREQSLYVRTAAGHRHELRPGWAGMFDGTTDRLFGVTVHGFFISIASAAVESYEQAGPDAMATDGFHYIAGDRVR